MSNRVVGVFHTKEEAIRVIRALRDRGYDAEDISIVAKSDSAVARIEKETGGDYEYEEGSKVMEGLTAGAAGGGLLGGIAGLLLGLGTFAIPGLGALVAAGPLAATLGGAAAGGAVGGIVGALVGMGIPEEDAKVYEQHVKEGRILVIVDVGDTNEDEIYDTFITNNSLHSKMYSVADHEDGRKSVNERDRDQGLAVRRDDNRF
ncbi:general stress protein [Bacillus marinisedimentorum]|uniref:general stress protein n=1 Tax=Bacillus marinisedimentorum TaxID=1821260 RepID=UPI0008726F05|nr:general stress protein [Bacillus marinisedimentorum]